MWMVRLAMSWRSPPLPFSSGFLLKAAHFYCIFSSTRRALEVCTSHSSSGCSTAFFPLHYSIDVSLSYFQSIVDFFGYYCFFHLTLSFSKAIGPFLTLLGPRNLPALSHQMYHWSSNVWETAFLCKSLVNSLFSYNCIIACFSVIFP